MSHESVVRRWLSPHRQEWALRIVEPTPDPVADAGLVSLPDADLVERSVAGDSRAFDVLVERHRRVVYQVCYRFVRQHEDASDLAQEVFVRAWRGLARFKGDAQFSTWLYRIAVNACLNRVASRRDVTEALEDPDRFEDTRTERPGASLRREERAEAVRRAIRALPAKQRATLVLRVYHDLPHQQIAEVLGTSVGAVKANFFHALGNLRKKLGSEP